MSRDARWPGTAGFALTEALMALLLLAIALLGAGAAVVEALAGQHAALLRTRASDLVSDLAESLRRGAPPAVAGAELIEWQREVRRQLPLADMRVQTLPPPVPASPVVLPATLDIQLRWRADRDGSLAELRLPVVLDHPVRLP